MFFYLTDSLLEIYSDISCTSQGVNFTFCVQFTGELTSVVVEINMIWAIINKHWQIETAFIALAETAGRDRKISDTYRKGYSCQIGEKTRSTQRIYLPMCLLFVH